MLSLCLGIQRCLRGTALGFCLRVIVNEKSLNLEKTTSSVLSVLLLIIVLNVQKIFAVVTKSDGIISVLFKTLIEICQSGFCKFVILTTDIFLKNRKLFQYFLVTTVFTEK